ncbi:PhzF family phenazine biosynthesis protein [Noviherbaspirillum aerium]|uniref:PhzF family phenazine biosynthesis protein n=1 Tax=Noviherbaspirillum aerium TaxID=2588497 RepID=UPI00124EBAD6|nr:PhzF family phenazine biosynthesis protein [Noviherbaspirillum aerium]
MSTYAYRLLNVFAESTFGGNPLCVFEDARGMDAATMQALARQFNLSETTFLLPPDNAEEAAARVRIFTPGGEMRFAGHPALGSAHVVRELLGAGDDFRLEFKAGGVPLSAHGDVWTFAAPHAGKPKTSAVDLPASDLCALLGLQDADLLAAPAWVDTGADQLLVPLRTTEAVRRARPDGGRIAQWPANSVGRKSAYVFAFDPARAGGVLARQFFVGAGGGIAEDPGTGSACANFGGWLIANAYPLPASHMISQGEAVDRPCRLQLSVSIDGVIRVGGRVIEIGRGTVSI